MVEVCFVSPEYLPLSGGTGSYVYYLSKELIKNNYYTSIVTGYDENKDVRINEPLNPTVFEIGHLGIQYGDRMADRIENRMMVFDGERFIHAEDFTLQPDLLPGESTGP